MKNRCLIIKILCFLFIALCVLSPASRVHSEENVKKVYIEDKASGQSIIQELRRETLIPVEALKVDTDKLSKAWASSGFVENGYILVPDEASWKDEFFDELTRFPEYKYDDQVDAFSNFVVHKVKEASLDDDYFVL